MLKLTRTAIAASLLVLSPIASPAHAQPTRVFVAAQGSDGNPCTFALPCRTFQHAHDVVAAKGEIDVLDPAGYGALTITKSISIQGHDFAGISVSASQNGIIINAGASDRISLRGLLIDGAGAGSTGILFQAGGSLIVENCVVRNLLSTGIGLAPTAAAKIAVSNTLLAENNGNGAYLLPSGTNIGTVYAVFNHIQAYHNGQHGIAILGNSLVGGSFARVVVVDSVAGYNDNGIYASSNGFGNIVVRLFRSTTIGNHSGVRAENGASVVVSQSNVEDDTWSAATNGCVSSYGDNYTDSEPVPSGCSTYSTH